MDSRFIVENAAIRHVYTFELGVDRLSFDCKSSHPLFDFSTEAESEGDDGAGTPITTPLATLLRCSRGILRQSTKYK